MKKRIITGIVAAAAAAMTLTACGSSSAEFEGASTAAISVAAKDYNGFFKHTAQVYKDYVTLGDYSNIEINEVDRSNEEITDEAVDTQIKSLESEYTQQEDITEGGTTQDGDILTLDYTGTVDGVEFEGGKATDANYTVGSGNFIEDLDKGLAGKNANTEYDIPVKFPDDYHSEELKGKDAVFKVKITKIMRPSEPTIDDAWVAANSADLESKGFGKVTTLAALKEGIKTSLKEAAVTSNNSKILSAALKKLKESSTISGYPEAEVAEIESNIKNNIDSEFQRYKQYMETMNSSIQTETEGEGESESETTSETTTTTADEEQMFLDYIQQSLGLASREDYDKYVTDYAQDYVGNKMLVTLIGEEQGFTASVDEIVERGEELAKSYGYDSYQAIIDSYGAAVNCDTGYQTIYDKVAEFMAGKVKMVHNPNAEEEHDHDHDHDHEHEEGEEHTEGAEAAEAAETTDAEAGSDTEETTQAAEVTENTEAEATTEETTQESETASE